MRKYIFLLTAIAILNLAYSQVAPLVRPSNIKAIESANKDLKVKFQSLTKPGVYQDTDLFTKENIKTITTDLAATKLVPIKSEVEKLFDPSNHPCALTDKVKKELFKKMGKKTHWTPDFVTITISKFMPDSVIYMKGKSLTYAMHSIKYVKNSDKSVHHVLLINCPTYENFDFKKYMLASSADNFLYTLDCSGYLNVVVDAAGGIPAAEMKTAAHSALQSSNSMFIAGGLIMSPIAAAYNGSLKLDTATRISILSSILATDNLDDKDIIDIDLTYNVVWASTSGSSSFNGKVDVSADIKANYGIVAGSGGADAGATITRSSSYSDYDTYLSRDVNTFPINNNITVSDIKSKVQSLQVKKK